MLFGMFALILAGILSLITGVSMTDDGNYHACVNNPELFFIPDVSHTSSTAGWQIIEDYHI